MTLVATARFVAAIMAASVGLLAGQETTREPIADARALLSAGHYDRAEEAARNDVEALRALHGDDALPVATANDLISWSVHTQLSIDTDG